MRGPRRQAHRWRGLDVTLGYASAAPPRSCQRSSRARTRSTLSATCSPARRPFEDDVTTQLLASSVTIAIRGDGGKPSSTRARILARLASSASLEVLWRGSGRPHSNKTPRRCACGSGARRRRRCGFRSTDWWDCPARATTPRRDPETGRDLSPRLARPRAAGPRPSTPRDRARPRRGVLRAAADGATVELFVGALAGLLGFSEEFAASFGELRGGSGEATGAMREAFERGLRLGNSAAPGARGPSPDRWCFDNPNYRRERRRWRGGSSPGARFSLVSLARGSRSCWTRSARRSRAAGLARGRRRDRRHRRRRGRHGRRLVVRRRPGRVAHGRFVAQPRRREPRFLWES